MKAALKSIFSLLMIVVCLLPGTALAQPNDAAPGKIRNVLLLVSDDLKASALGCYGNTVCQTPNIDALAARGMVFERAYCQGTVCGPSRTSFMHSRYRNAAEMNMGRYFKQHGYYSGRVGKIYHMKVPGDIIAGTNGKDIPETWTERFNSPGQEAHTPGDYACLNLNVFTSELAGRQSTAMPHRMFVTVKYDGDGSDQPDHKSATKAIDLLQKHKTQPFFLAVGFVRPHYPMVAPRQYFEPYAWQNMPSPSVPDNDLQDIPPLGIPRSRSALNGIDKFPANQKRMWAGYYASVQFMDEQVGRVLNELDRLGLRESTAIVFCSDHGYHLGEHTFWQKNNLHEEVTRVPLVISAPGFAPGRSNAITELVDIFPTAAELTGRPVPLNLKLHGSSLVPVLKEPSASVKPGALSFAKGVSWRTPDWAYMRYNDKTEELYDMRTDPDQFTNLAQQPEHAATKQRLAKGLTARLRQFEINSKTFK